MNSLIIVIIAGALFFLAYRFYARKLESLWGVDPGRSTPAFSKYDSVDYIPARNWMVLFGHHFASISGAGPIIGPVIAVTLWGWFPALIWVILGSIFIGGVHDFGSLITSVREGGSSVSDIAERVISRKAKIIFSLFVWLALILVIAVFVNLCAETFMKEPRIVLPSLGLIPIAMLVGCLLYNFRANTFLSTLLGLLFLANLIYWGNFLPIKGSFTLWIWVLFIYCYFASILPVNILLQPRDYLASFLLFFGMGAGYLGLLMARPVIDMPACYKPSAIAGPLWPMLFVTVACGAISGFHALIASGTSSKQIANERHAKKIGYGGMLTEGLLAILAILTVTCLFKHGENFAITIKGKTPIAIFGEGYGAITQGILGGYGVFIATTILNAFILTTLDTATRISRYLSEELFMIKNRYLSTLIIVIVSASLVFSGKWNKIWLAFGASNQLVAALALFVLSCWLMSKNKSINFTIWPAIFMLITTLAALVFQSIQYFKSSNILLLILSIILMALAGFMIWETAKAAFYRIRSA